LARLELGLIDGRRSTGREPPHQVHRPHHEPNAQPELRSAQDPRGQRPLPQVLPHQIRRISTTVRSVRPLRRPKKYTALTTATTATAPTIRPTLRADSPTSSTSPRICRSLLSMSARVISPFWVAVAVMPDPPCP